VAPNPRGGLQPGAVWALPAGVRPVSKLNLEVEMAVVEIWTFRTEQEPADLEGYEVEGVDGHVGKVTEASYELGSSWLVVDTGPPVLGRKVLLPAGVIESVDSGERKIYVDRTHDEIKAAPEHDPSGYRDQEVRIALADYYSGFYGE
jgi:hypothetical protein